MCIFFYGAWTSGRRPPLPTAGEDAVLRLLTGFTFFAKVTSSTELLSTPRERLIVLEQKITDVKQELGLMRLTWHRVRKHARAILLAGATIAGLLWARAAGMSLRWIH